MVEDYHNRKMAKKKRKREGGDERPEGKRMRSKKNKPRRICRGLCYKEPFEVRVRGKTFAESNEDAADDGVVPDEAAPPKPRRRRRQKADSSTKQSTSINLLTASKHDAADQPFNPYAGAVGALAAYPKAIQDYMLDQGLTGPTPVQERSWPACLEGKDVQAVAEPGSGKTLGYLLPSIPLMLKHQVAHHDAEGPADCPITLVLAPTRELAQQIQAAARPLKRLFGLSSLCLYGGVDKLQQIDALRQQQPQLLVATPGRLLDLIDDEECPLSLEHVQYVVLDEADKMLSLGLQPQLKRIRALVIPRKSKATTEVGAGVLVKPHTRRQRPQVLLFTATMPEALQKAAAKWQRKPVSIQLAPGEMSISQTITQVVQVCAEHKKPAKLLKHLTHIKDSSLGKRNAPKVLVFANRIKTVRFLQQSLVEAGFKAVQLHGDRSQPEREVVASNQHTRALFRHVTHTQQALLADQTGVVRASIVLAVLKEAAMHPQWRSHVVDLMNDLDDILAARGREVSAVPGHQFEWEQAATNICAAITQAAGHLLAAHKTGTSGASLLSLLLKRMVGWMASAASYLQRCHQAAQEGSVSAAYMEGLDPSHQLNSIAQARQALQGSPLAHMRTVFLSIIKACTSQAGQQPLSQTLASQPPLVRPLHILITACLEIPTAALSATSLDVALYETLADALAPACGRSPAEGEPQRAGDGIIPVQPVAVPSRDSEQLQRQLLHLVLGTYVRRYLCRSSFGHVVHERPAVNAVRFLERLFTQPSLRGGEGSLRALLPPLLGPILEAFCPVEPGLQRTPSLPTKHALYVFLQGLFTDNPTLVPPTDTPAPLSSTHFHNGPLQTGSQVAVDRFQVAMHAFLAAVCSDVLACVWKLCAPAGMPAMHSQDRPSHSHDLNPLTQQGCSSACGSLFSVLGPPRSLAGVEALYSVHNTAQGSTTAGSGVCWPADFPWRLAEAGLAFLAALGTLGQYGKHWLCAACPSLHRAMLHSPAHARPLRPAYQKLLEVLQTQNIPTLRFDLPHPAPVASHHQNGCYQPPQQLHQQPACHQRQAPLQQPHVGLSSSSLLPPQGVAAAAVVVKTEGQAATPRQQVYAHDMPFESIASLQPGDLLGLTGWLRRPPCIKMRKNGDSVLLLDLEDERGMSIRVICLGPVRDRAQSVVSSQQDAQPELPVILSLTNVAVSKQKALLHATQASQVHPAGSGTAASRIRQHALRTLAQSRYQTGPQADQSAAVQGDDVSQLLMSATQQSVAVSSQRTAQYHWGATQHTLTQQGQQTAGPTTDAAAHAQLPANTQQAQSLACATQVQDREHLQHAVSSGLNQQPQPHRKAAYAGQEKQQLPPTAAGMTALDIAQTVSQLCELSNTDRGTAMAALRRAIQESVRGKDAITNRAAEILLMS